MKVCIVSGYPPNIGRGAESTSMLVKSLAKRKMEIVILGNAAPNTIREEKSGSITLERVWTPNSLKTIFSLFRAIASAKADVFHIIFGYLYYGNPIFSAVFITSLLISLRVLRKPVVLTIHQVFSSAEIDQGSLSIFVSGLPRQLVKAGFHLINRILGLLSSKIVVVHKEHANILSNEYRLSNVVYIPISLSSGSFISKDEAKRVLGLENKKPILVFGFIAPYKGVEYAINAMPRILQSFPDALLIIAGTAVPSLSSRKETVDYIEKLKSLINDLALDDRIIMRNDYIKEMNVPNYFCSSEVIILPNTEQTGPSEVWRLSTMFGVPSVATEIGYFKRDIVDGETGLLVKAGDSESIAKATMELLTNNYLRKKICQNLENISEIYKAKNIARKHEKLYKGLLG